MLSGFEIVSGLTDGASVMPVKWNRPVFWFRFYENKISCVFFILAVRDAPSRPCHILLRRLAPLLFMSGQFA
jgi:hypothetical protein